MHSSDFKCTNKIKTLTQKQWEKKFKITNMIKRLHDLGWNSYQWSYTENIEEFPILTHFAEFFSDKYHGYLRGDSQLTVQEAVQNCLLKALSFHNCEERRGHDYEPFQAKGREYENGLIMCQHCGFSGYATKLEMIKRHIDHYENYLIHEKERTITMIKNAKEVGININPFE
jgi:hypothetical protein